MIDQTRTNPEQPAPASVPETTQANVLSEYAHNNREFILLLTQFHEDLREYLPQVGTDTDSLDLVRIGDLLDGYLHKMKVREVGVARGSLSRRIHFIKFAPMFEAVYAALRQREQHEETISKARG